MDLPIPKFLETYTPTPLVKFLIKKWVYSYKKMVYSNFILRDFFLSLFDSLKISLVKIWYRYSRWAKPIFGYYLLWGRGRGRGRVLAGKFRSILSPWTFIQNKSSHIFKFCGIASSTLFDAHEFWEQTSCRVEFGSKGMKIIKFDTTRRLCLRCL